MLSHAASHETVRCFCVAVATAYAILTRFDRLMVATKQLVGEQFHIAGMTGVPL
jgi:hypothetical protein